MGLHENNLSDRVLGIESSQISKFKSGFDSNSGLETSQPSVARLMLLARDCAFAQAHAHHSLGA